MDFKVERRKEGETQTLVLSGAITDEAEFPTVSLGDGKNLVVQMQNVNYINSSGIKMWILWVGSLVKQFGAAALSFDRLPDLFIRQALMIRAMLPDGVNINSFSIPYLCDNCDAESNVWFIKGQNWDTTLEADQILEKIDVTKCPSCGGQAQINAIPTGFVKVWQTKS
jgi:hypothetical protein